MTDRFNITGSINNYRTSLDSKLIILQTESLARTPPAINSAGRVISLISLTTLVTVWNRGRFNHYQHNRARFSLAFSSSVLLDSEKGLRQIDTIFATVYTININTWILSEIEILSFVCQANIWVSICPTQFTLIFCN